MIISGCIFIQKNPTRITEIARAIKPDELDDLCAKLLKTDVKSFRAKVSDRLNSRGLFRLSDFAVG